MSKQIKLMPCPFCGSDTPEIRSNGIGDFYVLCAGDEEMPHCGASSSDRSCETEEQAARRWNCRPTDSELTRLQQSNAALVADRAARDKIVEQLRKYTAIKYAGDCRCGKCQLIPRDLIDQILVAHALANA